MLLLQVLCKTETGIHTVEIWSADQELGERLTPWCLKSFILNMHASVTPFQTMRLPYTFRWCVFTDRLQPWRLSCINLTPKYTVCNIYAWIHGSDFENNFFHGHHKIRPECKFNRLYDYRAFLYTYIFPVINTFRKGDSIKLKCLKMCKPDNTQKQTC